MFAGLLKNAHVFIKRLKRFLIIVAINSNIFRLSWLPEQGSLQANIHYFVQCSVACSKKVYTTCSRFRDSIIVNCFHLEPHVISIKVHLLTPG